MWRTGMLFISICMIVVSSTAFFLPLKNNVRHTKWMLFASCLCFSLTVVIAFVFEFKKTMALFVWMIFFFLGVLLSIEFFVWKIDYAPMQDYLIVRTILKKQTIHKNDVVGITERKNGGILHLRNGHRISADSVVGWNELIAEVEGYQAEQTHNKNYFLPDIPERLFRGNLINPGDFILAFVLLFVFFVASAFAPSLLLSKSVRLTEADCNMLYLSEPAISVTADGHLSVMDSTLIVRYLCRNVKYMIDVEKIPGLIAKMNRADQIEIAVPQYELAEDNNGRKYYNIRAIWADGEPIISFEQTSIAARTEVRHITLVPLTILLLYIMFVVFFCYFVSNARRYPKTVRYFVKEEWLNN